jgi:hypothetical protein
MNAERAPASEPYAGIRMVSVTRLGDEDSNHRTRHDLADFCLTVTVPRILQSSPRT